MVAMRPTNMTLGQGFFPGPRYASPLGKSPARLIANATRETPNRSDRASLKVVSKAAADTIAGPIPLPRANKVAASGEEDCDSLVAPSTEIAVPFMSLHMKIRNSLRLTRVFDDIIMELNESQILI
jgi:hypothetical protein